MLTIWFFVPRGEFYFFGKEKIVLIPRIISLLRRYILLLIRFFLISMKTVILQSRMTFPALKKNCSLLRTIILLLRRFVFQRGILQYQFAPSFINFKKQTDQEWNLLAFTSWDKEVTSMHSVSTVNRFYYQKKLKEVCVKIITQPILQIRRAKTITSIKTCNISLLSVSLIILRNWSRIQLVT